MRVHSGFFGSDPAIVNEGLHPGVIVSHPLHSALTQQVAAGVADVNDAELGTGEHRATEGRPHPFKGGVPGNEVGELVIGVGYRSGKNGEHFFALGASRGAFVGEPSIGFSDVTHRNGRGKVTCGCASHAVSDDEQPRGDVSRVLVVAPDQTDFGMASNIEGEGHRLSPAGDGHGGPADSHLVPHRQARRIFDALTVDMGAVG